MIACAVQEGDAVKIYLGGKMNGKSRGDNWRNGIVDDVTWHGSLGGEYNGADGIDLTAGCGAGEPPEMWPVLPKAIFGKYDYVGPYLVACDHGCFHTGDHATSIEWGEASDEDRKALRKTTRQKIAGLCNIAMLQADIFFFWFDSLDAYGTLAELVYITTVYGMANVINMQHGDKEIKKYFFVAAPSLETIDEMWLALELAHNIKFIAAPTPKEALTKALATIEEAVEYSPIEKKFIEKWQTIYGNGIHPQYNVPGFRYRVDFAFPSDKIAIELDGYEYHNSKEQFTNDRKRQREMELAGWRFIRFSGSEVYKDVETCVKQAHAFWQSMTTTRTEA